MPARKSFWIFVFFQFLKKRQFVYLAVRNGVCGFPKFLFEQQQEVKFRPGKGSKQTIQIMNFETKTKKFLNVRSRGRGTVYFPVKQQKKIRIYDFSPKKLVYVVSL